MAEITRETMIDGRYRVLTRVGSGGMADVFCAEDTQLGRKVALKMLHRRFAADVEFVERFHREAQAAAGLSHPNVVAVYDRGEWDGTYYIAMEYLPGRSLKELIRAQAPLEPLRAIDLTIQILKAARAGHARGVIHRDLKPHNVIVDENDRAKVTDFGIARAGASDMTETGSIMGTAQYLSPEQAQGRPVSAQSDLYAIGVILYEMLTASLPFEGETAVTIALKHVSEPPPPPTQINPAIPHDLEQVVMWALEKDEARRPPDARSFMAALEEVRARISAGTPEQATASFTVPSSEAPTAYQPPPVFPPAAPPPPAPARPGEPGARWPWALLAVLLLIALGVGGYLLFFGAKERTVPKVVGQDLSTAQTLLSAKGFSLQVKRAPSDQLAGTVLAQSPKAGAEARKGTTVALTVSSGPSIGTVPDVEGITQKSAEKRIRRAGFEPKTVLRSSLTVPKGQAILTAPSSGSQLPKGRSVTLQVSTGQPLVAVPSVLGQDLDTAENQLVALHFSPRVVKQESDKPEGTVLAQDPAPKTTVPQGSTVTLTVAKKTRVDVPNVVGMTQEEAINALSKLGLVPQTVDQDVNQVDQDGLVVSQQPGSGTQRSKGATVRIVIGRFVPDPNPGEQPPGQTGGPTG